MLEEILDIRNVQKAFKQVTANKGAGGIDGMQTDELRDYLNTNWQTLKKDILEGNYCPQAVRKVEISKEQGGTRMLGIPTVIDRLLQQATAQWLSPRYEEEFSDYSYGFREKHNAHQAVIQAQLNLNEGYEWVVELDLEKFFDRVNHDKLMGLLAKKITDKRTLKLLRSYLNSGIMEDGVVIPRTEGTPQGSPLSPLMSNIVLDELDKELQARGHRYVRYADDCAPRMLFYRADRKQCFVRDGGRSTGTGLQELVSNHRKLHTVKSLCSERYGKRQCKLSDDYAEDDRKGTTDEVSKA
jgi:RNA-directed DNA polymerase